MTTQPNNTTAHSQVKFDQPWPSYVPDGKSVGVTQAEFRVSNVVEEMYKQHVASLLMGHTRQAEDFRLMERGAKAALDAVWELQRNYEGRE